MIAVLISSGLIAFFIFFFTIREAWRQAGKKYRYWFISPVRGQRWADSDVLGPPGGSVYLRLHRRHADGSKYPPVLVPWSNIAYVEEIEKDQK